MCLNKVISLSLFHCHIYNNCNLSNNSNVRNKGLTYITYIKNYYSCALNIIMQSPSPDTPPPRPPLQSPSPDNSPPPPHCNLHLQTPSPLHSPPQTPPLLPCNLHPQTTHLCYPRAPNLQLQSASRPPSTSPSASPGTSLSL